MTGLGERSASDRLAPMLVKDVRSSLRGKLAPVFLLTAVSLQLAWALWILVWKREGMADLGAAVFLGASEITAALVSLFVPFWAMASLAEELDGHAEELALVPRLGAGRVVLGKFLAALVLVALAACVLFGLGIFGAQLGGMYAGAVPFYVLPVFLGGAYWIAVGLALVATVRVRWARSFAMIALLAWIAFERKHLLYMLRAIQESAAEMLALMPSPWVVMGALHVLLTAGLVLAYAAGCLMHPEESRSTLLRKWGLALVLVTFAGSITAAALGAAAHDLHWYAGRAVVYGALVAFLVATEPDRLPRTHGKAPGAGVLRRLHDVLFVSGGGRGAVFVLALVALAVAHAVALRWIDPTPSISWYARPDVLVVVPSVFVLVPAGVYARWNTGPKATLRLRLGIAAAWVACGVLLLLARHEAATTSTASQLSTGLPGDLLGMLVDPFGFDASAPLGQAPLRDIKNGLWLLFVIAALVVNARRMLRGAREVGALRSSSSTTHAAPQP